MIFCNLVKTDLLIFKEVVLGRLFDSAIWVSSVVLVVSYVFPALGMTTAFGPVYSVATIVSSSFFEVFYTTFSFTSDLERDSVIFYFFILPIPTYFVLLKNIVSFACRTTILSAPVLPLVKLILWNRLDLSHFSLVKFLILFVSMNLLFGSFSLFIASIIKGLNKMGSVWTRFLFPLWFFGGTQFSWETMTKAFPILGYILLLNPVIYATEGLRSAVLGTAVSIPFWICLINIWIFCLFFTFVGIVRLKKRFDFV
jgi:ABC-2 type transport system permease protein